LEAAFLLCEADEEEAAALEFLDFDTGRYL
jgi:hypothetical protein